MAREAGLLSGRYGVSETHVTWLKAALIALVTLWVYSPAMFGDWVWDDSLYLSHNPLLQQPGRLWKAWFQPGSFIEYYPLEQTIQWVQWQLWGDDTFPYHMTNVLLHIADALLLWRLLVKLGIKLAWIGGLIFAVHPMNVESVAWISEFKNVLSLVPALLAMSAWIDYDARGQLRDYRLALGLFLVSMLCKITMAMFPFVILLYVWWKRGRIGWSDLRASVPFFLISLVLGILTHVTGRIYLHQVHESLEAVSIGGALPRLALAGTTVAFYFAEIFLPLQLLPIYPQWTVNPPSPWEILPWLAFGGAVVWLWTKRQGWGRHALLGLGFFFINVLPFSGLHEISYMNFTWVMDHILYLPIAGIIGLIAAVLGDLDNYLAAKSQVISTALITLLIALLAFRAHWYAAAFTNDETFWAYAIDNNPGAWLAQNNMGKAVLTGGDPAKAVGYFATAAAEKPDLAELHGDLGNALAQSGQVETGIAEMRRALQMDPDSASVNNNLGVILARGGKTDEAITHFLAAVRAKPDDPEAYNNLGNAYVVLNKLDIAANWYEQALKLRPGYAEALYNLGSVRLKQGKTAEAVAEFVEALKWKPNYIDAHANLGVALGQLARIPESIAQFEIVLQLDPNNAAARENLAKLRQAAPK